MRTPNRPFQMFLFFIVLTLLIVPLFALPVRRMARQVTTLSVADSLTMRGVTYHDIAPDALRASHVPPVVRGDTLTFTYTLPSSRGLLRPALRIKTRGASLAVYSGDELIFAHDQADASGRIFAEWGSHFVPLPQGYETQPLLVCLTVQVDHAFLGVCPPLFGERTVLMYHMTYLGLLPLFVALFMCAYGVFFILISMVFALRFKEMRGQLYAAVLCLISGVWLLCYHEFLIYLLPDGHALMLEYALQYLSVPVYYLYLKQMRLPLQRKSHLLLAVVLSELSVLTVIVAFVFGIRINLFLSFFAVIVIAGLYLMIRFFVVAYRTQDADPSEIIQMTGLAILTGCILLHLLLFYLEDFRGIYRGVFGRNVMTIGIALFLESQLINYFMFVTRRFAERMEKTELEEMAYRDFLTKLPNRTDAERVFLQMTKSTQDFCVVMFDLNDLKEVNDKNGHDAGDHLLVEFAQALRVSFDEGSYVARIGGDEFVAVLEGVTAQGTERHLRALTDALYRLDIIEPHIAHSVSYGYAFRHECAENKPQQARSALQMAHGPADFADVDYNFTLNRRRAYGQKGAVKEENVESSESRYASGDDILQRTMSLADKRMYERKRLWKLERAEEDAV